MYQNYRIVAVIPAGRKRFLELLIPYLLDSQNLFDEIRFWVNTNIKDDIEYMKSIVDKYPIFTMEELEDKREDLVNIKRVQLIRHFFKNCIDVDTIYIRFDDDICWIENGAIERLIQFRIDNPQYFLVYPAIINSGRTAYIHQVMGLLPERLAEGWPGKYVDEFNLIKSNPEIGVTIHNYFLESFSKYKFDEYKFDKYIITNYEKVPINCICWYGKDFAAFDGIVGKENVTLQEELWLTTLKTKELKRPSCIYGQSLMAHYAFHTQRNIIDQTNIYLKYQIICNNRHHLEKVKLI